MDLKKPKDFEHVDLEKPFQLKADVEFPGSVIEFEGLTGMEIPEAKLKDEKPPQHEYHERDNRHRNSGLF